jgi:hypothetical protein
MVCRQCGASIDETSRFCKACGTGTAIGIGPAAASGTPSGTELRAPVSAAVTEPVSQPPPQMQAPPPPVQVAPPLQVAPAPASRRPVYALVGVVILAGIVIAAVIAYRHTRSVSAAAATAAASTGAANAPAAADAAADQYRWTGLSEEQIQAARGALDAAIAHEEHTARAPATGAQEGNSPGVQPATAPDKVQL